MMNTRYCVGDAETKISTNKKEAWLYGFHAFYHVGFLISIDFLRLVDLLSSSASCRSSMSLCGGNKYVRPTTYIQFESKYKGHIYIYI